MPGIDSYLLSNSGLDGQLPSEIIRYEPKTNVSANIPPGSPGNYVIETIASFPAGTRYINMFHKAETSFPAVIQAYNGPGNAASFALRDQNGVIWPVSSTAVYDVNDNSVAYLFAFEADLPLGIAYIHGFRHYNAGFGTNAGIPVTISPSGKPTNFDISGPVTLVACMRNQGPSGSNNVVIKFRMDTQVLIVSF